MSNGLTPLEACLRAKEVTPKLGAKAIVQFQAVR